MPSFKTEIQSLNEAWAKKHQTVKSPQKPATDRDEDLEELLHLKCRLINTVGNESSEVDVRLAHRSSPVYTVGKKEKPTLDEVLGSIPLVYNPVTKQLELESAQTKACFRNGTCFSMDRDGPLIPRDLSNQERVLQHEDIPEEEEEEEADACVTPPQHPSAPEALAGKVEEDVTQDSSLQQDTSSFTSLSTGHSSRASSNLSLAYSCDNLQAELQKGAKPKKWGLSNLFTKLPWKSKAPIEDEAEQPERCPSACSSGSRRSEECPATSTTALILENRPSNLPAKSLEEEIKHKQLYEEMIRGARKKELQDAKVRKKQAYHQQKLEEQLINATKVWNDDILPKWNAVKDNRKTRELWWKGLPPSTRGRVWRLAIGNDLNITQELFDICTARSKEKIWVSTDVKSFDSNDEMDEVSENAADFIKLDVSRTFPQLGIFQEGGPYHNTLEGVLGAYVIYRPDIGYVQGMSFLAAMLLLNMDTVDTFICFCNLLNRPCQLSFFRIEQKMMTVYYSVYEEYFKENLPKLFHLFEKQNLSPDLYLVDWLYTLYSKSLPLDVASRVWDIYLRDGDEFLVKTALGILRMYEEVLMEMDFIHLAQFLTKLPEDIDADKLFGCIGAIRMTFNKKSFAQVLQQQIDLSESR